MTYDNITLKQKYEMDKYAEEYTTDLDIGLANIAYLEGTTVEELYSMDLKDVANLQTKYDFLSKPISGKCPKSFEGYKLILDLRDLKFGDFIDMMELMKTDVDKNRHKIIAKLWTKPMSFEYRSEYIYNNMSASEAYGLSSFFLLYCQSFESNMSRYLEKLIKKMTEALIKISS
jgi:hypothetical protein